MTTTAIEAALAAYRDLGWSVFPILDGEKKTTEPGWPDAPDDYQRVLDAQPANVAVRLGERSGMLADVDLDDAPARAVAPLLLPATGAVFGRDNVAGVTHRLYVCPDGPPRGQRGTTLMGPVELRWTGAYTVLPPSRHPEGGRYRWQPGDYAPALAPPAVAWGTLHRSVTEVAAAALLLRCYPRWATDGERHLATLALAGALLSEGWDLPRVERFVFALATAGGDEEATDRVDNARSQWDALQRGAPMTGWRSLAGYAGSDRVDRVKRLLGVGGGSSWAAIMGPSSRQNGVGGTPGQQPPQSPQTPNVAPKPPAQPPAPAAPVIVTTAQAAQQAAATATKQRALERNEVAYLAVAAVQEQHHLARDEGMLLYLYREGVYRSDEVDVYLRRWARDWIVAEHGPSYLDQRMLNEVMAQLAGDAPKLEGSPDPAYLPLANGRLNVLTGHLEPHSYRHLSTLQLPVKWEDAAACPAFEKFCAEVFPADAIAAGVHWEVVALCALPLRGIDKAILLLGDGSNGKSVFLETMLALVGEGNTSSVSLQAIGKNIFATADLRGKLLNVSSDLPSQRLEDSGDFKAIVSGETIRAERKHQPAFKFRPFCRLLFSANYLPESVDASSGYSRRWYLLPFDRTFDENDPARIPRQVLVDALTSPAELAGILRMALPAMQRLLSGGKLTVVPSMADAIQDFVAVLDPLPLWLENELRDVPQGWIETQALITRYRERTERRGRPVLLSYKQVANALRACFPNVTPEQKRAGGTGSGGALTTGTGSKLGRLRRGWRGVSWRNGL